ncbi:tail assembly protein [Achromobacter marplatensis]|uniref:tail assembly protein n=1 Tax=Achromobacter marplatensis TaxID=470868 RepID=UPI000277E4B8|nr:tail assembly protein [Achromobacter marplatensis]EJO28179.1 phage HK022 GP20-like protein [Achromobacter marplatensis]
MSEKLREVRLYGWLGTQFGRVHRLAVRNAAEAVRALCVVLPGFEKALTDSEVRGVRYACFLGKRNLGAEEFGLPCGDDDIRIAPIPAGAKNGGLFQTILGAALIASAFVLPQTGLILALSKTGAIAAPALLGMGISMAMGGVVQLLSPQQRGLSTRDSPDNGASYSFNGPVNTSAQGNPVPVLYGRMIVGSAVISAGIFAEDQV